MYRTKFESIELHFNANEEPVPHMLPLFIIRICYILQQELSH